MTQEVPVKHVRMLIHMALQEDLNEIGDLTSDAIFSDERGRAEIVAKAAGILAGAEVSRQVFLTVDPELNIRLKTADGSELVAGQTVMELEGKVRSLLRAERTALNFLGRLSGIATLTNRFVRSVAETRCRILDTRKTTPGYRELEKYAVRMGGGLNHRMGLYDMVLIKDNHIAAAGGIRPAVEKVREYLAKKGITAQIEVEAATLQQVHEAADLNVDRILLDNMSLDQLREAVRRVNGRLPLEASGNVTLESVRAVAETGVDFISVGALTHSAPVLDFSMKMVE